MTFCFRFRFSWWVAAITCVAAQAQAHIVLVDATPAVAGADYKASLRVGHGCQGSATTALTLYLPPGFQGAKPQPKAGWQVSTQRAKLAQPYNSHGKTVTDDVVSIRWQAATLDAALPDAQFDEFAFMGRLPDVAGPVWVKVLQTCVQGHNDWSDTPASGTSTQGLPFPAVLMDVQPSAHTHLH